MSRLQGHLTSPRSAHDGRDREAGRQGPPRFFELHELGSGADRYTLDVDAERGVLLAVTALRNDEPFHRITTLEITLPVDCQLHCVFFEPSDRPPAPAQVSLQYRSQSGNESVNLSQTSAVDRPSIYDELSRGDGWEEVSREGTLVHVTKPEAAGHQVQAYVERDGTFVFLMSETLNADQLTTIAARLRPAPPTSGI